MRVGEVVEVRIVEVGDVRGSMGNEGRGSDCKYDEIGEKK